MDTKIIVILALIASMGDAYGMGRFGSLARATAQVLVRPADVAARTSFAVKQPVKPIFAQPAHRFSTWSARAGDNIAKHYLVLGLPETACLEEVFIAHRKLMKKWHPDLHQGDVTQVTAKTQEINAAREAIVKHLKNKQEAAGDRAQASAQAATSHNSPFVGNARDKRSLFFGAASLVALSQWLMKREEEKQLVLHDDLMAAVKKTDVDAFSVAIGAGVDINRVMSEEISTIDVVLKEIEQKELARQKGAQEAAKQMAAALEATRAQENARKNRAEQAAQECLAAELALRKKEDVDPATKNKMNERYGHEEPRPFKISLRRLCANVKASAYAAGESVYAAGASAHALYEQAKGVAFDAYGKAQTAAFSAHHWMTQKLAPEIIMKDTTALDTVNSMLEKQREALHTKKKLLHEKDKNDARVYQTLTYQVTKMFGENKAKEWCGLNNDDTLLKEFDQVQHSVETITKIKDRLLDAGAETAEALQQEKDVAIAAERMGF